MKSKSFIITGATIAAIAMCGPVTAFAASKKAAASASASPAASAASSPSSSPAKVRAIPFRGTVSEVDQNAKTFTIQGKEKSRVFKVTDNSKVTKAGAPATFADITANSAVTGSYWKQADGTLECKSVKVGGAAADTTSSKKSKASTSASPAPAASPKK